ncbi:Z1 domain-containing protein [Streptomyces chartreusis]|uniref:Z1 domain-containing protein n=1 Tax=Streptomyces chartreusis TaxID=1969 RepID=UPI00386BAAE5|nr:Z1 domain-containing protein [Streptomyces chartreusis]
MDAAWKRFQGLIDGMLPHEATQQLHDFCVPEDIIEEMVRRHETATAKIATLEEPLALGRENALRWYAGPRADDKNWPAYEKRVLRMLGTDQAKKIDEASDRIVAMIDHPATPSFRSRGLVLGHVQSGKTSNFNAVVCKAADRGYRMFIILSGVTNSLRRQTQTRLIRDLVDLNPPLWHQITKPEHDFVPPPNAQSFLASKDQCLLLVVKKNGPVLRKLRDWLEEAREQLVNCPTLIIDDEADQATVATRKINPLIRDVIGRLPKVCYIGYTATPFANLLIDPANDEDFYPRDFILSLPRSEAYQGPEALFGRNPLDGEDPAEVPGGLDMIRTVPLDELNYLRPANRAALATFTPRATPSLRRAVLWFWMATAARYVRGQSDQHSSMLIHSHSDTRVHDSYGPVLEALRSEVQQGLANGSEIIAEMQGIWADETLRVDPTSWGNFSVDFNSVLDQLSRVVSTTKIVMDHYRSTERLDYDSGPMNVIAVGGNTLSRGLTLEGLVVSYFVRSSNVYDSLLQMGRWFGYRPGYEDLPRIFMPEETRRWFTHLATVEAEMRLEIDRYLTEHQSPLDMAVRIRCHPKMRVTAPSKSKDAKRAAASYAGQLVETRYFPCTETEQDEMWHANNATAVDRLMSRAHREGQIDTNVAPGRSLWRDVPLDAVLSFIDTFTFHQNSVEVERDLMREYIKRRNKSGALIRWNVGVIGNKPTPDRIPMTLPNGLVVGHVVRTRLGSNADDPVADIKTLTGPRDEALDLELPIDERQFNRTLLQRLRMEQQASRGLILLYPIDAKSPVPVRRRNDDEQIIPGRAPLNAPGQTVWGVAVVFPQPTGADATVEYDYLQADLSKVFPSSAEDDVDDDASVLDQDLDTNPEDPK